MCVCIPDLLNGNIKPNENFIKDINVFCCTISYPGSYTVHQSEVNRYE